MLKNSRRLRLAFLAPAALLFAACSDNPVVLSDEQWSCEDKRCGVSFVLTNQGKTEAEANYKISAQSSVQTITADMRNGLVVAEIQEKVKLAPGEVRTIDHRLEGSRMVTNVVVSAWVR